jgi:hypothetical protein
MLIPLGFFGGGAAGDYELIQTIFGNGSAGSLEFSSIPQTYKHLQIRSVAKVTAGGSSINNLGVRLNGSAGAYDYRVQNFMSGNDELLAVNVFDLSYAVYYSTNSTNSMLAGAALIDIPDYTANKKHQIMIDYHSGTLERVGKAAVLNNVSANGITSVQLFSASGGAFTTNSRFSLYGIK